MFIVQGTKDTGEGAPKVSVEKEKEGARKIVLRTLMTAAVGRAVIASRKRKSLGKPLAPRHGHCTARVVAQHISSANTPLTPEVVWRVKARS